MAPTEMRDYCLRCGAQTQVTIAEDGAKQWVCPRGHGVVHLEPVPAEPAKPEEGKDENEDENEEEDEDEDHDDEGDKPKPPKKAPARHAAKKATPHAKKK